MDGAKRKQKVCFDPISVVYYYLSEAHSEEEESPNQLDHIYNMLEMVKEKIMNEMDKCPKRLSNHIKNDSK